MAAAVVVGGLSKRYWIDQRSSRQRNVTLRDELTRTAAGLLRSVVRGREGEDTPGRTARQEFWALQDVSFDVAHGDVVGIVGRNGAGKSTLLKILSRITEPTSGHIEIEGRVASLLEVGTGFHAELTGRENIFLNGAILGMSRTEIRAKFDEIVAFAEISKFLDTPVKRYSSGMYVRLAFAVAAHLDPEILIVDEVLAVGDIEFQKKCLGKMQEIATGQGRTVLFVSHQLGTIRSLCNSCVLLKAGRIERIGKTHDVLKYYVSNHAETDRGRFVLSEAPRDGDKEIIIESAESVNSHGEQSAAFVHTEEIGIDVMCRVNKYVPSSELRLVVGDSRGRRVFTSDVDLERPPFGESGTIRAIARIPSNFLRPETYTVEISVFVNNQVIIDSAQDAFDFIVQDGGSKYAASEGVDYGCVFADARWSMSYMTRSDPAKPLRAK